MNWSDVGRIVGRAAPVVGGLLAGPAGASVGSLLAATLGVDPTPESVDAALGRDPEALAKVAELQINAKVELQKLAVLAELQLYQAESADRDSARKLAAQQPNDLVRPAITFIMVFGSLFIMVAIVMGWANEALSNPVVTGTACTLIGVWLGLTRESTGFWFGMTKDAQKQNAAIVDFATQPGTVTKPDSLAKQPDGR